ncbi:MAG TPA: 4Fe-4S dicluster domain-containing protein [Symbiobacteriaceae bacterium]|nr:4Fe-4S dicluster domain-containing protein [Symbiobacteriaceae bacterium]
MRNRLGRVEWAIRRYRRASQLAVLLLLIVAPFLHIFRFDVPTTSLYLFGMRLWVKHFFFVSLLVTVIVYVVIAASVVFGRIFCGWVCPQNLFNELTRQWDARLGRTGSTILSAVIGLFGGFVVWSYFTDGVALLRQYAAGQVPLAPTVTILAFGAFFTGGMAWWRTGVCRVFCPYGHLQSVLSGPTTMHLELMNLPQYKDICASCGLCYETCHMAVDPRTLEQKDCVACGDCLDACQVVSKARKVPRVLNFVTGAGTAKALLPRLAIPAVLVLVLTGITAWGIATRDLVSLVVAKDHRAVLTSGGTQSGGAVMRVSLMNLASVPDTFTLTATGLPDGWAHFEKEEIILTPGAKADIALRVTPTEFKKGLYNFQVTVTGLTTGATESFKTVHVVGN